MLYSHSLSKPLVPVHRICIQAHGRAPSPDDTRLRPIVPAALHGATSKWLRDSEGTNASILHTCNIQVCISIYVYVLYYKLYTLHYITLHFIALHCITLHYITYTCIINNLYRYSTYIYIYMSRNICTWYHIISTYTYIILYTHMCNSVCVIIYMCK